MGKVPYFVQKWNQVEGIFLYNVYCPNSIQKCIHKSQYLRKYNRNQQMALIIFIGEIRVL